MKKKNRWLIAGIVVFFIILAIDLYTDLKLGDKVNHQRGAIIRFLGLMLCLPCFVIASNKIEYPRIIWSALTSLGMIGFNFWNLFDGFYNIFRGYGWFFTGSEDGAGDAVSDNLLQAIPVWAGISLKILGSLLTIFLYYKNKQDGTTTGKESI